EGTPHGTKNAYSLACSVPIGRTLLSLGQVWCSSSRTHPAGLDRRGRIPCRTVPEYPQKIYANKNVLADRGIWSRLFRLPGSEIQNHNQDEHTSELQSR